MPVFIENMVLYTVEELADILGLSRETIRKHMREKKLRGRKMSRVWYATSEDLQEYFSLVFGGTLELPEPQFPPPVPPAPVPPVESAPPPPPPAPPPVGGEDWRVELERLKARVSEMRQLAERIERGLSTPR
ncbi:MAG: helix-turn-helix domain-containing protein [Anaerolineae bacterium]|nr:helix-turn-helix domain-containing protein [Anaerolineae bacterium]